MRGKGLLCASAAVVTTLMAASPAPASAAVVGFAEGDGNIVPALTTVSQPVNGVFNGELFGGVVVPGVTPALGVVCGYGFQSTGAGDSIALGQGTFQGNCAGVPWIGNYMRVGDVEVDMGTINATCVWVPTSLPIVSSFIKACWLT